MKRPRIGSLMETEEGAFWSLLRHSSVLRKSCHLTHHALAVAPAPYRESDFLRFINIRRTMAHVRVQFFALIDHRLRFMHGPLHLVLLDSADFQGAWQCHLQFHCFQAHAAQPLPRLSKSHSAIR